VVIVALAALAATWAAALGALGGWPGPDIAEERYFIQAAPFVLIAAFAALELPRLPVRALAAGAVLVLVLLVLSPMTAGLSSERAFLVPVAATMTNLAQRVDAPAAADLAALDGTRTLLMVAIAVAALALAAGLRRFGAAVLVPAVVVQLAFAGYAVATMHGRVPGVPGVTSGPPFAEQGFVDGALSGGDTATILADGTPTQMQRDLETALFNDELARTTRFPGIVAGEPPYPVNRLAREELQVGADLAVTPAPATRYALAWRDSPLVQLDGRPVAERPERRDVLLELAEPARATWVARGLGPEGEMPGPVRVGAAPARWTLTVEAPPGAPSRLGVALGSERRTVRFAPSQLREIPVDLCTAGGPQAGTLTPRLGVLSLRAARAEPCA
jgi:hypothetical protein